MWFLGRPIPLGSEARGGLFFIYIRQQGDYKRLECKTLALMPGILT